MVDNKARNFTVDVVKGMAICGIVLAHSSLKQALFPFVSAMGYCSIPLFFFLSGVFLSTRQSFSTFLYRKTDILMKPYFAVLFLYFIFMLFSDLPLPEASFSGILYASGKSIPWIFIPMWYIPITWLTFVAAYLLIKNTNIDEWHIIVKFAWVIILIGLGWFLLPEFWDQTYTLFGTYRYHFEGLPFSADLLLVSLAFMLTGYFLKDKAKSFKMSWLIFFIASMTFLYIFNNTHIRLNLFDRAFDNPAMTISAAICGAYSLFSISELICKSAWLSKIFIEIGRASLFILIFHLFIHASGRMLMREYAPQYYSPYIYSSIIYPFSIAIPILLKKGLAKTRITSLIFLPRPQTS